MKLSRKSTIGVVVLTFLMAFLIYFVLHNFAYFTYVFPKQQTKEQFLKNLETHETSLKKISDKYNVKLKDITDEWFEEIGEKAPYNIKIFQMDLGAYKNIEIRFDFSSDSTGKGVENFTLTYNIDNKSKANFNTDLFVDLANSISSRKLNLDFCNDFLNAPESKYPASDKIAGEKISKVQTLNFYMDWMIFYTLEEDDSEQLEFYGLAK